MSVGKIRRYPPPFSNVVAAGVATNEIKTLRTIEQLQLKLGGTTFTKAMITDLKVKVNGKTIWQGTGTQLDKLSAFRGETVNANFLNINFTDLRGLGEVDRMVGALDCSLIQAKSAAQACTINLEVTIAGATAPTLLCMVVESATQSDPAGNPLLIADLVTKVLRYPYNVAAGGQLSIPLPFGANIGTRIKRLHLEHTGNAIAMLIRQDGNVIHESLLAEVQYEQTRQVPALVPQTNWYSVDWMMDGNFLKTLNTNDAKSLELIPTFSAADNGYVIVEYVDPLGNL